MTYRARNPFHGFIIGGLMVGLGLCCAYLDNAWFVIVPIVIACTSVSGWAGVTVALTAHSLHMLRYGMTIGNTTLLIVDVVIGGIILMTDARLRQRYFYTSMYPLAIGLLVVRSVLIVGGTWILSLFSPVATATQAPIDILTLMLTGPGLMMTAAAIGGIVIVNVLLRSLLP